MNWTKNPQSIASGSRSTTAPRRRRSTTRSSSRSTEARRHVHLLVARFDQQSGEVGGLVFETRATGRALQPLAGGRDPAKLRFDPVTRNLYYACDEGNHIRVTVGHVAPGQRTGIRVRELRRAAHARRRLGAEPLPRRARHRQGGQRLRRMGGQSQLEPLLLVLDGDQGERGSAPGCASTTAAPSDERVRAGPRRGTRVCCRSHGCRHAADSHERHQRHAELAPRPGAAAAYPWYGYAALVENPNTAKPQVLQTRFTSKPMHYGAICNSQ